LIAPVVALLVIATLFPARGTSAQAPAPTGPITIGVLAPSTGPFATYARDIIDGARLYSEEVGGQLGRRKLELVVEDYQTKPDVALTKIRKLVERDQAKAIVGLVLSAAALAVTDYVNAQKVPLLISGFAVAENLTLQQNPYVFRVTYSAAMTGAPIGRWTSETIRNVDQFLGLDPADYLKKPRLVTSKGSFAK
jgi:branched-chain amino acid transport system substrate-binding protein